MKNLFLLLACVVFAATTSFAQTAPAASTTTSKASAKYVCPKCHGTADKAGTCSHCKVAMIKEGTYYCPGCYATSDKAGHCKACNKDLVKMSATASAAPTNKPAPKQ